MNDTIDELMLRLDELYGELHEAYDRGDYSFETIMRIQCDTMMVLGKLMCRLRIAPIVGAVLNG